jgi:hypothetical protein
MAAFRQIESRHFFLPLRTEQQMMPGGDQVSRDYSGH